jgi:hypothetical protein
MPPFRCFFVLNPVTEFKFFEKFLEVADKKFAVKSYIAPPFDVSLTGIKAHARMSTFSSLIVAEARLRWNMRFGS